MAQLSGYRHLLPKRGSKYQQLFVNGRIMAEVLYRETVGIEPLSPEEVAKEYGLPVEAVREAIHYCEHNPDVLAADRARESENIIADGRDRWPYAPKNRTPFMNLYLDDDSIKALLASLLRKAGHQVVLPASVGLAGADDPEHLLHAVQQKLVLLTRNHDDFRILHLLVQEVGGRHPGIFVVRRDNDPTRDMKDRHVVRAIANLEAAGAPIVTEFHVLNHWR